MNQKKNFARRTFKLYKYIEQTVIPKFRKVEYEDKKNIYDFSLKLMDVEYPYSCTFEEGLIMLDTILRNQLKSGYEIATAFGISSLFIGSGFKVTRGHLQSIDCYIEESKNDFIYSEKEIAEHILKIRKEVSSGILPSGLKIAQSNADELKISKNISYIIGVSPQDVITSVNDNLDFVFIDGGHFGDQPLLDFEAVKSKIRTEKCALFFHDNNGNPATAKAIKSAEDFFGIKSIDLNTHWHLTVLPIGIEIVNVVNNKVKKSLLKNLFSYLFR